MSCDGNDLECMELHIFDNYIEWVHVTILSIAQCTIYFGLWRDKNYVVWENSIL